MNISAVIFDMDGLLLDSERLWLDCWGEVAELNGLDPDVIRTCACRAIGVTKQRAREVFFETAGQGLDYDVYLQEATRRFRAAEAEGRLVLKSGALEILRFLKERGIATALATSTAEETARRQMRERGCLDYFDICVFGSQVARSKPAPDIFLEAARILGQDPADCLVLEDSFNGVRAAAAAGMHCIMVPDLLQPDDELRALPDYIMPDLDTVRHYLQNSAS